MALEGSCPVAPLLPYLLRPNLTAVEEWAEEEARSLQSALPLGFTLTLAALLLLLAGERLTRLVLFLCGALVMYVVGLWTGDSVASALDLASAEACLVLILVPLVFGLLGGVAALYMLKLAFAFVGLAAGAAVAEILYMAFLHQVSTGIVVFHHDLFYFLLMGGLAIPCCLLMLKYREALLVCATAALGAVGLVPGLAILAFSRIDSRFLWVTNTSAANKHLSSPFVYGQALAILLYFPIGLMVQRKWIRKADSAQPQPYVIFNDDRNPFRRDAANPFRTSEV